MSLQKYQSKRNFGQTAEPKGKKKAAGKALIFVVQRHAATRLHYDFRLELDGVLKSWAIPKGPSMNPDDRRLAMMVEDHPYDYRTFEGTIPEGNYGAGEVEIWDKGTYMHISGTTGAKGAAMLEHDLKAGSLKFVLKGRKLKGEFALVHMKTADSDNAWLLIKHKDDYAVDKPYDAGDLVPKSSRVSKALREKEKDKKPVKKTVAKKTTAKKKKAPVKRSKE